MKPLLSCIALMLGFTTTVLGATYIRGPELYRQFSVLFPLAAEQGLESPPEMEASQRECFVMDYDTSLILSVADPEQQEPHVNQPETQFVNWYRKCLEVRIKMSLSEAFSLYNGDRDNSKLSHYLGLDSIQALESRYRGNGQWSFFPAEMTGGASNDRSRMNEGGGIEREINVPDGSRELSWAELDSSIKSKIVEHILTTFVGPPQIWRELRLTGEESVLVSKPLSNDELIEALAQLDIPSKNEAGIFEAVTYLILELRSVDSILEK